MATKDKAMFDQKGLGQHREITNTGGKLDEEMESDESPRRAANAEADKGPEKAGLKTGDDAWHNDANRSSEKGDGAVPMQGGNTAR
jgi:hypothetical protein